MYTNIVNNSLKFQCLITESYENNNKIYNSYIHASKLLKKEKSFCCETK